jgi:hypothetical protein
MSHANPSLTCSKLTTHCTPGGSIDVNYFDEYGRGKCLRNDIAAGNSISQRSEQMFLIDDNENHYQFSDWLLSKMILLA